MVFVVCVSRIGEIIGDVHAWSFFVRASAFEVPDVDKHVPCSTRHEEYCGNFPQNSQPLFAVFSNYVNRTSKFLQIISAN